MGEQRLTERQDDDLADQAKDRVWRLRWVYPTPADVTRAEVVLDRPVVIGRARGGYGRAHVPISVDWSPLSELGRSQLSSWHVEVMLRGGVPHVRNVSATNPLFVDGRRLASGESMEMVDGGVLRAGEYVAVFVLDGGDRWVGDVAPDVPVERLLGRRLFGGEASLHELERARRALLETRPGQPFVVRLQGPTGTGKELIARVLHHRTRPDGPFVPVNCAGINEAQAEAELFGNVKNIAPGVAERAGVFRSANNGTVLLDEVHRLPVTQQAKLLRVLRDGIVPVLGATPSNYPSVDVQVIAATSADLNEEVESGRMIRDLLYRLNLHVLVLGALSSRRSHIVELALALLRADFSARGRDRVPPLHPALAESLCVYAWPGNIAELSQELGTLTRNYLDLAEPPDRLTVDMLGSELKRALERNGRASVSAASPSARVSAPVDLPPASTRGGATLTEQDARSALDEHGGRLDVAAQALGLSSRQFQGMFPQYKAWQRPYVLDAVERTHSIEGAARELHLRKHAIYEDHPEAVRRAEELRPNSHKREPKDR